jgi:hypothetical protein
MAAAKQSRPRKATKKKKAAARKRAAPWVLVNALAEAAWAEADAALAEALTEFQVLSATAKPRVREESMALLGQALARASRKRGLAPFGVVGARERFDAMRHVITGAARVPKEVRVVTPGVTRGAEVIVKARVSAVRARVK